MGQVPVTNGGNSGTSGTERRAALAAVAAYAVIGLGFAIVNALSELDERSRAGRPVGSWEPWTWELTSFVGFLAVAPLVVRASQRLRPPFLPWRAAIPLLALLSVPISIAHVAIMTGLRHAIYAAVGDTYRGAGPALEVLLYEYRKDLLTYAALLLLPHVAARLLDRDPRTESDFRLEIRDGSRTVWLAPGEIDWAQAAGNYVELHGRFGALLHRRTLAALEEELRPHGFVRVHRSRIVRLAAVVSVETKPSGDFDARLSSGEALGGSRRFRSNLA
jgi:DNA-binding LytR/AlgR family response regulator